MELRTDWDAKIDKNEVSVVCEAHNMELHTALDPKMDKGHCCMQGSQYGYTHRLGKNGQKWSQFCMQASQYEFMNHLRDKDKVSVACKDHNMELWTFWEMNMEKE